MLHDVKLKITEYSESDEEIVVAEYELASTRIYRTGNEYEIVIFKS